MYTKIVRGMFAFIVIVFVCHFTIVWGEEIPANIRNDYQVGDYVYFDPVTLMGCDSSNYWTLKNTGTTCYRWIVVGSDTTDISMILDHNVEEISWDLLNSSIVTLQGRWNSEIKNMRVMSGQEAANIALSFGNAAASSWKSSSATSIPRQFFLNTRIASNYGYWLADESSNDPTYAYRISEYGNIGINLKSGKRGFRPVITVDKSKVVHDTMEESEIVLEKLFAKSYTESSHQTLQGMTIAGNQLFFIGFHNNNDFTQLWNIDLRSKNYGLAEISGKNNPYSEYYLTHGNAMTYNPNTNYIYVSVGINDNKDDECSKLGYTNSCIIALDRNTLEIKDSFEGVYYSGLGFLDKRNQFIGYSSFVGYVMDEKFQVLDSFDMPTNLTTQDITVHDGLIYFVCYELGGASIYQTFYDASRKLTNRVYVYDLDDYKLVDEYFIGYGYQEAEGASFYDINQDGIDELILGFNTNLNQEYFTFYSVVDTVLPLIHNLSYANGIISAKLIDSLSGVRYYAVSNSADKPTKWIEIDSSSKYYLNYSVHQNGVYYIWVKDNHGNINKRSFAVEDALLEGTSNSEDNLVNPETGKQITIALIVIILMISVGIFVYESKKEVSSV